MYAFPLFVGSFEGEGVRSTQHYYYAYLYTFFMNFSSAYHFHYVWNIRLLKPGTMQPLEVELLK